MKRFTLAFLFINPRNKVDSGTYSNVSKLKKVAQLLTCFLFFSISFLYAQNSKAPIMGWSSWNFRIHIDEQLIRQQADAMITIVERVS